MQRIVMGLLTCYAITAVGCGSSSTTPPVVVAPASTQSVSTVPPNNESKLADKIVGAWVASMGKGENAPGETLEFTKDGKFIVSIPTEGKPLRLEGTYKLADKQVTTTVKTPEGEDVTETTTIKEITDARMIWQAPGGMGDVIFNRKKQ